MDCCRLLIRSLALWLWLAIQWMEARGAPTNYLIRTYTSNDGLRSDTINNISQSEDGYLWLATYGGLVRFDGVRFRVFDRDSVPELGTRVIYSVSPDVGGRLWILNERHQLILRDGGGFRRIPLPRLADGREPMVVGVHRGASAVRWIHTQEGGVHAWSQEGGAREVKSEIPEGCGPLGGEGENVWYIRSGPTHQDSELGRIREGQFEPVRDSQAHSRFRVDLFTPNQFGGVWIVSFDPEGANLRELRKDGSISAPRALPPLLNHGIWDFREDRDGQLWFGTTSQGLVRLGADWQPQAFTSADGLGHDQVRSLFIDREGNIWAGTDGGGISVLTPRRFQTVGRADGLPVEVVYSVSSGRDGALWVATHGGSVRRMLGGGFQTVPNLDAFTWSVFEDRSGATWVGDLMNGLARGGATSMVQVVPGQAFAAACDDGEGGVWAGGASLWHWKDGALTQPPGWPARAKIAALACDGDGNLWIGTVGDGLWRWRAGKFESMSGLGGRSTDEVQALYVDAAGVLWIGTTGGGLGRLKVGRLGLLTPAEGLPDKSICGITEDRQGDFWFTSFGGVFQVSRRGLEDFFDGRTPAVQCRSYDRSDGLATIQCTAYSQPKIAQTPDGRLWFATMRGLATVDPARMKWNTNPPPVVIEEVECDGRRVLDGLAAVGEGRLEQTPDGPVLTLPRDARRVQVRYSALSFTAPGKVRFQHRMIHRDRGWVDAGGERVAAFDGIVPGRYWFEVIAANNDGVWNGTGTKLELVVPPHFWQTLWFRSCAASGLFALVAAAVRMWSMRRLRARLVELERQNAVDRERARIARDIHDDVGASITQVGMLGAMALEDLERPAQARGHLEEVARLSHEVAGRLDELVWAVNPNHDTTASLADYICQHAAAYLKGSPIRCRFDVPAPLAAAPLSAADRNQVFLTFKEVLHNVVKHSGATEVWVRISQLAERLVVVVEDNGRGFDPGGSRQVGEGLANMRQRMEAVGGHCEITTLPGQGTRVRLELPVVHPRDARGG